MNVRKMVSKIGAFLGLVLAIWVLGNLFAIGYQAGPTGGIFFRKALKAGGFSLWLNDELIWLAISVSLAVFIIIAFRKGI